ncbi:cyclohexanecarboxylate-CoA ligase [Acidocella aminolytica]|uniref:Fatty-acid (Long-chain)--CoA ligase n=1 Tax=Acidocella aminolytica 101 = DSM 11237 TaxID=1120923 RepID=A0A0D6PK15_9PROT|nr:cyclohexanecarboxylate-CoA ligase [Acidocella aminolytica]GAN82120.1 fatty-acid (long-chain)--CoA ligase [Acidocella aminolytica 101 = DSM 11237]GBQ34578.1 cyclohexanecarboxylate-CoA ligase [Acidocella aminolytica 101 = DSM 11237]SHF46223.1 cyclohexanecarboxylate-CoA ligase [Acidocella aminolytica 101 = DSM 11237]
MQFDAVLLKQRRDAMVAGGFWLDRTINDALDDAVRLCPEKLALTAYRIERGDVRRFTYAELSVMADRIAVGLSRLGIGHNDVVACQLPNSWELFLLYLACSRIGAVMNPLMHIFRERELRFMLDYAETRLFIVPKLFRKFDYEAMAKGLQTEIHRLERVIVAGGDGEDSFEALLSGAEWEKAPDAQAILSTHRPGGDDITQLLFTSGTTGQPKGVMHSANTLISNIQAYAARLHLGANDTILMASPMAHQTGFMYGLMMPIILQARAVLQDIWQAPKAAEVIRAESVSFTMASTPFLMDLTHEVEESGKPVPTLRCFLCAGAPIPGPLVAQAQETLGAKIISAWGMTENGAVTLTMPEDDDERAVNTDGKPLPGVKVKILDDTDQPVPPGVEGRLFVRSCSNFGGYLKSAHLNAMDEEGWFDSGDIARMDERGYIRIAGRSKDVIIRGGENIPVVEIEALLYQHPAIASVAIVGYDDARMGERACAFVVPHEAHAPPTLRDIADYLRGLQVAIQYVPERLEILEAMPTTPSGKIQKFKVRNILRQRLVEESAKAERS